MIDWWSVFANALWLGGAALALARDAPKDPAERDVLLTSVRTLFCVDALSRFWISWTRACADAIPDTSTVIDPLYVV